LGRNSRTLSLPALIAQPPGTIKQESAKAPLGLVNCQKVRRIHCIGSRSIKYELAHTLTDPFENEKSSRYRVAAVSRWGEVIAGIDMLRRPEGVTFDKAWVLLDQKI